MVHAFAVPDRFSRLACFLSTWSEHELVTVLRADTRLVRRGSRHPRSACPCFLLDTWDLAPPIIAVGGGASIETTRALGSSRVLHADSSSWALPLEKVSALPPKGDDHGHPSPYIIPAEISPPPRQVNTQHAAMRPMACVSLTIRYVVSFPFRARLVVTPLRAK